MSIHATPHPHPNPDPDPDSSPDHSSHVSSEHAHLHDPDLYELVMSMYIDDASSLTEIAKEARLSVPKVIDLLRTPEAQVLLINLAALEEQRAAILRARAIASALVTLRALTAHSIDNSREALDARELRRKSAAALLRTHRLPQQTKPTPAPTTTPTLTPNPDAPPTPTPTAPPTSTPTPRPTATIPDTRDDTRDDTPPESHPTSDPSDALSAVEPQPALDPPSLDIPLAAAPIRESG